MSAGEPYVKKYIYNKTGLAGVNCWTGFWLQVQEGGEGAGLVGG